MSGFSSDRVALAGLVVDDIVEMSRGDLAEVRERWRSVYARSVFQRTGQWIYRGYDWHVFSHQIAWRLERKRAAAAVNALLPAKVILFADAGDPAEWCAQGLLREVVEAPRSRSDIIVAEPDMEWTYVCTHEECCGPYFSRPDRDPE